LPYLSRGEPRGIKPDSRININHLKEQINNLENKMEDKFNIVEKRFDKLENTVETIRDNHLPHINDRLTTIETELKHFSEEHKKN
jgi:archaellum component FlaC